MHPIHCYRLHTTPCVFVFLSSTPSRPLAYTTMLPLHAPLFSPCMHHRAPLACITRGHYAALRSRHTSPPSCCHYTRDPTSPSLPLSPSRGAPSLHTPPMNTFQPQPPMQFLHLHLHACVRAALLYDPFPLLLSCLTRSHHAPLENTKPPLLLPAHHGASHHACSTHRPPPPHACVRTALHHAPLPFATTCRPPSLNPRPYLSPPSRLSPSAIASVATHLPSSPTTTLHHHPAATVTLHVVTMQFSSALRHCTRVCPFPRHTPSYPPPSTMHARPCFSLSAVPPCSHRVILLPINTKPSFVLIDSPYLIITLVATSPPPSRPSPYRLQACYASLPSSLLEFCTLKRHLP